MVHCAIDIYIYLFLSKNISSFFFQSLFFFFFWGRGNVNISKAILISTLVEVVKTLTKSHLINMKSHVAILIVLSLYYACSFYGPWTIYIYVCELNSDIFHTRLKILVL